MFEVSRRLMLENIKVTRKYDIDYSNSNMALSFFFEEEEEEKEEEMGNSYINIEGFGLCLITFFLWNGCFWNQLSLSTKQ